MFDHEKSTSYREKVNAYLSYILSRFSSLRSGIPPFRLLKLRSHCKYMKIDIENTSGKLNRNQRSLSCRNI